MRSLFKEILSGGGQTMEKVLPLYYIKFSNVRNVGVLGLSPPHVKT